jgi:hypothetical protein
MTRFQDMTFSALSRRADSVVKDDTVADILGGEDYRQITAFLEHDIHSDMRGDDTIYRLDGKRIIGVALCDLDDPLADIEVMDRYSALAVFGPAWVERMEYVQ